MTEQLQIGLKALDDLVKFLKDSQDASNEKFQEILLLNHQIFDRIRTVLKLSHRIFFTSLDELRALLENSYSYEFIDTDRDEYQDSFVWIKSVTIRTGNDKSPGLELYL